MARSLRCISINMWALFKQDSWSAYSNKSEMRGNVQYSLMIENLKCKLLSSIRSSHHNCQYFIVVIILHTNSLYLSSEVFMDICSLTAVNKTKDILIKVSMLEKTELYACIQLSLTESQTEMCVQGRFLPPPPGILKLNIMLMSAVPVICNSTNTQTKSHPLSRYKPCPNIGVLKSL